MTSTQNPNIAQDLNAEYAAVLAPPRVVAALGSPVVWPTVETLAVLQAMTADPYPWHRTSELGKRVGLTTAAVYWALRTLAGWGWVWRCQQISANDNTRCHIVYTLTVAGEPHARRLVADPAAGIPVVSDQQRAEHVGPVALGHRSLAVLDVLGTDPERWWTVPDVEAHAAAAARLAARRTRAELTKLLWRGWLTVKPTNDRMVYALSDEGRTHTRQYAATLAAVTAPIVTGATAEEEGRGTGE